MNPRAKAEELIKDHESLLLKKEYKTNGFMVREMALNAAIITCTKIIENYYEAHYETEGHYYFKEIRDFWGNVKEELNRKRFYEALRIK